MFPHILLLKITQPPGLRKWVMKINFYVSIVSNTPWILDQSAWISDIYQASDTLIQTMVRSVSAAQYYRIDVDILMSKPDYHLSKLSQAYFINPATLVDHSLRSIFNLEHFTAADVQQKISQLPPDLLWEEQGAFRSRIWRIWSIKYSIQGKVTYIHKKCCYLIFFFFFNCKSRFS